MIRFQIKKRGAGCYQLLLIKFARIMNVKLCRKKQTCCLQRYYNIDRALIQRQSCLHGTNNYYWFYVISGTKIQHNQLSYMFFSFHSFQFVSSRYWEICSLSSTRLFVATSQTTMSSIWKYSWTM